MDLRSILDIEASDSIRKPLEIAVLSINYHPEPAGFAPHVTAFCEHMAGKGHKVAVLTGFPFAPRWSRWPEYRRKWSVTERRLGVDIVRHTHFIPRTPGKLVQRVLMEASFCLAVLPSLLRRRRQCDLIVYVGAQPSLAMLARIVGKVFGIPYSVWINDLAAGAANDVGIVTSPFLGRLLAAFEARAYRGAKGAVVLCRSFKEALVGWGYDAGRIEIIRSPVDTDQIKPLPYDPENRRRFGMQPGDFIVLFAGSMGLKQGLENIVAAAQLVRFKLPQVRWILVGEGETRERIGRLIESQGLGDRMTLFPFQPVDQLSGMFSMADILLLNQVSLVKDTVIPSKLLTYMSAGRPILAAVNSLSQGAEIVRESGGGIVVPPDDPQALANAVGSMIETGDERERMGRLNREFAVRNFDRHKVLASHEEFVLKAVREG